MADNLQIDEGTSGKYAATDDCGAAGHVPLAKLAYSANGVATPIDADADGLKTKVSNPSIAGTAGSPNAGVLSVQGIGSGTPLAVNIGGQIVIAQPNFDPGSATLIDKHVNYTTAQTGTAIHTPTSGFRIAITSIVLSTYGITTGKVTIWFGGSGDTAYTIGTDRPVFCASFTPSAALKPGAIFVPDSPVFCPDADYVLRITTDAALSLDAIVHGFEW